MERQQRMDGTATASAQGGAAGPWTVRRLLAWMIGFLGERGIESPRMVAEILIAEVLKVERLRLYMEPDRELDPQELAELRALVTRAGRHEPVQFLVGHWPFLGREYKVAPCTLIPRPSTETLVEQALDWYRARGGGSASALDLCTGSGCVAVSMALGMRAIARPSGVGCKPLASAQPHSSTQPNSSAQPHASAQPLRNGDPAATEVALTMVASDIVADAVELARSNAARHGASVDVRQGDLYAAVRDHEVFDIIASNPPYVTDAEYDALDRNVREYEPASALRGGRDGLDFVRRIVAGAHARLNPGGLLAVEIGWKHGEAALALVAGNHWRDARVVKDCDGIDRVLCAVRSGA